MTRLGVAPEVDELREAVQRLSQTRIASQAGDADTAGHIPTNVVSALSELGILSPFDPAVADELTGRTLLICAEELAQGDPGIAFELLQGAFAALCVTRLAPPDLLSQVATASSTDQGPPLGSLWLYEGFGRGPVELETELTPVDGGYLVNGAKSAVVRPGTADFAVLFGRCGERLVAAVLDQATMSRCVVTRDDRQVGKLGLGAAHTGNVAFADLFIPTGAMLGAGLEPAVLHQLAASARLLTGAIALGAGAVALRYAAAYSQTREAFGRPISEYQGVTFPLAEADMALAEGRQALHDLAMRMNDGGDPDLLSRETGYAVMCATAAALTATITSVNTLGGHGFLTDHPVERWYRAAGTLAALDHDPLLQN
jgi:alkylation response protein AidB-like acyl-CoA dehydrogenase